MAIVSFNKPRIIILLIVVGIVGTSIVLTSGHHNYWGAFSGPTTQLGANNSNSKNSNNNGPKTQSTAKPAATTAAPPPPPPPPQQTLTLEEQLFKKLAIIFPINEKTDMQFYRNTWLREYLYPVCDWPGEGCKIACNKTSTYDTLDEKTFCFSRAMKHYNDKEFFIKLDDDSFVDRDYVFSLMKKHTGSKKPVYISDHTRLTDPGNKGVLDQVLYGNGKFYMFNFELIKCLDVNLKYNGPRNEDLVFGGMVNSGCGEPNVVWEQENDDFIWHKKYEHKNKYIDLAHLKNH
ncbi:hypothetical protein GGI12_003266 [Dipsacomyces acuminosporus]|nr:hypothetical protein GGI12_003266 [Dipsacomyces acuminosporus]